MSWVAVGSGGISALGGIAGSLMGGSGDKEAIKQMDRQLASSTAKMLVGGRDAEQYNAPYYNLGLAGAPLLQYYTTGVKPTGYEWTGSDENKLSSWSGQEDAWKRKLDKYNSLLSVAGTSHASRHYQEAYAPKAQKYESRLNALRDLRNKQQVSELVNSDNLFQASPLYDWQQQQGEKAINRQLAARGLYGSRDAINALSDFNSRLGAEESQRQYGRIMDMVNIGRGAASQNSGNAMAAASQSAQTSAQMAPQMASLLQQQGQNKGSMYSNLGALPMQMLNQYQMSKYLNNQGGV